VVSIEYLYPFILELLGSFDKVWFNLMVSVFETKIDTDWIDFMVLKIHLIGFSSWFDFFGYLGWSVFF
jgi:hypothetical protein